MTTVFPGAVDSFSTKVDNVTTVMAADVNNLQDAVVAVETAVIAQAPNPNLLYHTLSHDIWPEGVTFNDVADDSYVAGLWNALWTGNAPDVSGITPAGAMYKGARSLKCLFDTNGSQAGFIQFISYQDTVKLRGKTLSFSIDVQGFNVSHMRCSVLKWTGTADAVTSDVVATWATGNPTLATSWAYLDTPADQNISGSASVPDRIVCEGVVVPDDATVNNLAVFVWTPDAENSTDYVVLGRAKMEEGLTATDFVAPSFNEEVGRVQQWLESPLDLSAATPTTATSISLSTWSNTIPNGKQYGQQFFKTRKYKAPTVTVYPYTTVANTSRISNNTGTDQAASSGVAASITTMQFGVQNNSGGDVTTGNNLILFSWLADARL